MVIEIPVIVVVDQTANFQEVQAACTEHGLTEVSSIARLGMLHGLIDPVRITELKGVPGVTSIEREREIQLPPRDSPVQ